MRRGWRAAGWICALLCLAGCAQPAPQRAADGADWGAEWVNVGNVLGVDTPEGMTLRENNDALAASGMYYATWSAGEEEPFINKEGQEARIYDAQLYLLLAGYDTVEKAEESAAEWLEMASSQYAVEEISTETCNGQAFTVLTYTYPSEKNPYARGASAFGVYGNYAVSAELSCREGFSGSAREVLTEFLERCHYAV